MPCAFKFPNGDTCNRPPMRKSRFCFGHDPKKKQQRLAIAKRTASLRYHASTDLHQQAQDLSDQISATEAGQDKPLETLRNLRARIDFVLEEIERLTHG